MLANLKDKTTSMMARNLIQNKLGQAGRVVNLSINSQEKSVKLSLELQGETSIFDIYVEKYSIQQNDEGSLLHIEAFECSRAWVKMLFDTHYKGRPLPIPGLVASALV